MSMRRTCGVSTRLGSQAFYWPTSDKLAFVFTAARLSAGDGDSDDEADDSASTDGDSGLSWRAIDRATDSTIDPNDVPASPTPPYTSPSRSPSPGRREAEQKSKAPGFSSGEKQLKSLQEITARTHAGVYLLDEWDANLDAKNRAAAEALVASLAARAVVVEISHRDRV